MAPAFKVLSVCVYLRTSWYACCRPCEPVSHCFLCICHALQFLFPCPLRTKQYMQDRDFNANFLFYPGAVGSERVPPGLPLGAVVEISCAYPQVQPLSPIAMSHVQVLTTTIRYRRSTGTTCGNMLLFCNHSDCLKLRATSIVGQMGLCSTPRCWMYLRDSG